MEEFNRQQKIWVKYKVGVLLIVSLIYIGWKIINHPTQEDVIRMTKERYEQGITPENRRDMIRFDELAMLSGGIKGYILDHKVAPLPSTYKTELAEYNVKSFTDPTGKDYYYSNSDSDPTTFYLKFTAESKSGKSWNFQGWDGPGEYCFYLYSIEKPPCVEQHLDTSTIPASYFNSN